MRRYGLLATVGVLGLLYAVGHSQPATPEQRGKLPLDERKYGTLNLSTRLGSFRAINCEGRMEFTFTGTVLISRMDGDVQVTGNVRKEYEFGDRKVYYGTGRVVITEPDVWWPAASGAPSSGLARTCEPRSTGPVWSA